MGGGLPFLEGEIEVIGEEGFDWEVGGFGVGVVVKMS